jgi:hypothetical protein
VNSEAISEVNCIHCDNTGIDPNSNDGENCPFCNVRTISRFNRNPAPVSVLYVDPENVDKLVTETLANKTTQE